MLITLLSVLGAFFVSPASVRSPNNLNDKIPSLRGNVELWAVPLCLVIRVQSMIKSQEQMSNCRRDTQLLLLEKRKINDDVSEHILDTWP